MSFLSNTLTPPSLEKRKVESTFENTFENTSENTSGEHLMETPELVKPDRFRAKTPEEMRRRTDGTIDWLWDGYLARRNVTLLTSQWKAGKTTLVSVLLSRLASGLELAGRAVRPGRSVVVSEEDEALWVARDAELGFGGRASFICRPFDGRPSPADWLALVQRLEEQAACGELDLAVIDSLAGFVASTENDATTMVTMLKPLQRLAARGAAVLVLHHPRKAPAGEGRSARGSGALLAAVDVTIEMDWFGMPSDGDRRRVLRAFSRHKATPRRLAIEWTTDGRDCSALGDAAFDDFDGGWPILQGVLEDAHQKLTRKGILKSWPQDYVPPSEITLWRWLERAMADGRVQRDGLGRSRKPFRFWLTGQEERWKLDPFHLDELPEFDNFDLIRAAGNVMHNSAKIDEARGKQREKKRKKPKPAVTPAPEPREVERPCYPFGEEARRIEDDGRYGRH
jgi:hypothetical protein